VPRHRHPVQLVHDSVAGVLDIAVELVIDPGRYFLQEPKNTPTDLLLGDLKSITCMIVWLLRRGRTSSAVASLTRGPS